MGNGNRSTGSNAKVGKPKSKVKQPKASNKQNDAAEAYKSSPVFTPTGDVDPASPGTSKTKEAEHTHHNSKDWMRAFIAIWRIIITPVIAFLDKNNGAVTAVATIAIAVLTCQYVAYSKKQWEAMRTESVITQRQLDDSEAEMSARLIIDDFGPQLTLGTPGQGMLIQGSFRMTNVGSTIATDIYFTDSHWGSYRIPGPVGEHTPLPDTNGLPGLVDYSSGPGMTHYPALAQGKSLEYPVATQEGQWDKVKIGQWFVGDSISVTYTNIFHQQMILQDCFMYDYRARRFLRCPTSMAREDRLIPKQ